jgi:CheY-like chemotaxis protein
MLTNLIFNAVDAMPQGGSIRIRSYAADDRIILEVVDTGLGMPDAVRLRCFEPFFSTKGEKGTGLGLAMVYGIVERHQGVIDIVSNAGQGTTFTISFPIALDTTQREITCLPAPPESALRILVVDDQPLICQLLQQYLSRDGHQVETALNGCEALAKFQADRFDLVITDKAMPEMDGGQLAILIKQFRPAQPIILLTGFGDSAFSEDDVAKAIDLIVSKPVSMEALRAAVTEAMSISSCQDNRQAA